jgi:predicted nucleic acid-binding protein
MNSHVRDCLVIGYQSLIPSLTLPDINDRHVLAAAIRAGADVIVTYNLKDFPVTSLEQYGIEAQHPDEFITHLIDLAPPVICEAAKRQRMS